MEMAIIGLQCGGWIGLDWMEGIIYGILGSEMFAEEEEKRDSVHNILVLLVNHTFKG